MSRIISCLLGKASGNLISKKTVGYVADVIQSLESLSPKVGSQAARELSIAKEVMQVINDRISQRSAQATMVVDIADRHLKRVDELLARGYTAKEVASSFSMQDEAMAWKHGISANTASEKMDYYTSVFSAMLADSMNSLTPNSFAIFRSTSPAVKKEFIEELFRLAKGTAGEGTASKEIRAAAKAAHEVSNLGAESLRRAGADLRKLNTFLVGFKHDPDKMALLGKEAWTSTMRDVLDLQPIHDLLPETAKSTEELTNFLSYVYDDLVSGGVANSGDYARVGLKNAVNRRMHHRLLQPKDADSYIRYHEQFSTVNPLGHMQDYVRNLGRDLGTLEFYGPKPEAMINAVARRLAAESPEEAVAMRQTLFSQASYLMGGMADPSRMLDAGVEKKLSTIRNLNLLKLGKAAISAAVQEPLFIKSLALRLRGLPVLKAATLQLKYLVKTQAARKELSRELAKTGIYIEGFLNKSKAQAIRNGLEGAHRPASLLAEATMEYSGLNLLTNSTKGSAGLVGAVDLADATFETLAPDLQKYMTMRGISAADLSEMQALGKVKMENWGVEALSPSELFSKGRSDLGEKLHAMLAQVIELASPTANQNFSAVVKSASTSSKASQISLGLLRSFTGYPSSWYFNHVRTAMHIQGYGHKAALFASTLVGAAVSTIPVVMILDALNGKVPTLDSNTVMRALERSSFIPLLSDFIMAQIGGDPMASSESLADKLAGAIVGDIGSALVGAAEVVSGGAQAALGNTDKGVKTAAKGANKLVSTAKSLVPFSSMWYSSLIMERLIWDNLRHMYDPNAAKAFRDKTRRAKKNGTPYWWKPE